jgi:tetratricopeptide (TPR) repeat protein
MLTAPACLGMASGGVESLFREAVALRQAGKFAEAVVAYRRVLTLDPGLPDCWYNIGWMERRLGRPDAALAAYGQALRHGVTGPEEVHLNIGVIFMDDLNRVEEAAGAFNAALELNPRYVPALLNLANLQEDLGARAEAATLYERLLAIDPECWEGLARYANLKGAFSRDDQLIARLEAALARAETPQAERASMGFALGRARDLAGDYGAAFDAYEAANRASRDSAPSDAPRYDPVAHEQYIDALISAFPTRASPASGRSGAPTIFICGMFRSGSTLLEQALAGHPRVTAGGEIPTLPALAGQIAPFPAAAAKLDAERLGRIAETYRASVARLYPNADVLTDKRPDNFLLIGLAKLIFPAARILHTVRDPVDTCLSTYFLHLDHTMAYAKDLKHIAHYFGQYRRLVAHWKTLYPDDIHDFDYDAFVRAPRATLESALQFCGLEWDERCLAFHEREALVRTASVWQVREPLYQRSSGRAQFYESRVAPLRAALKPFYPPAS